MREVVVVGDGGGVVIPARSVQVHGTGVVAYARAYATQRTQFGVRIICARACE